MITLVSTVDALIDVYEEKKGMSMLIFTFSILHIMLLARTSKGGNRD